MFASRSPDRAETCEQTLRARRLKTPCARRSVCKSSLFQLPRNQPLRQACYGLKEKLVPIIPPVWRAAILAAVGRAVLGEPRGEGRALARPLTGKAAFQTACSRRVPIENWQHWDWQHFHIPSTPTAGILVYFKPLRGGIRQAGAASFGEAALSPLLSGRTT